MFPPQPQLSLPTPMNFTFQACSRPFCRRSLAIGPSLSDVIYSIQSEASWTVPLPTFMQCIAKLLLKPDATHTLKNLLLKQWTMRLPLVRLWKNQEK